MDIVQELVVYDVLLAVAAAGAYAGLGGFASPWLQATPTSKVTSPSATRCVTRTVSSYAHTSTAISTATSTTPAPFSISSISETTTTATQWLTHATTEWITETITHIITEKSSWQASPSVKPTSILSSTTVYPNVKNTRYFLIALPTLIYNLDWMHFWLLAFIAILGGLLWTLLHRHGFHAKPLTSVNEDLFKWSGQIKRRQDVVNRMAAMKQEKEDAERTLQRVYLEKTNAQQQLSFARIAIQRLAQCDPNEITGVDDDKALERLLFKKEKERRDITQREDTQRTDQRKHLKELNTEQAKKITKIEAEFKDAQNSSVWWSAATTKDQRIKELEKANTKLAKQLEEANEKIRELQQQLLGRPSTIFSDLDSNSGEYERLRSDLEQAEQTICGLRKIVAEQDQASAYEYGYYRDLMKKAEKKFEDLKLAHATSLDANVKEILSLKADNDIKAQLIIDLNTTVVSKSQEIARLHMTVKNAVASTDSNGAEQNAFQAQRQQFQPERDHLIAQVQNLQAQIEKKTKALITFQEDANQAFISHKTNWDGERTALTHELNNSRQEQHVLNQDVALNLEKAVAEARKWEEYANQQCKAKNEALDAKDREISQLKAAVRAPEADRKELEDLKAELAESKFERKAMADDAITGIMSIKNLSDEKQALENLSERMRGFIKGMEMLLEQLHMLLESKSRFELGYDIEAMKANIGTALTKVKAFCG